MISDLRRRGIGFDCADASAFGRAGITFFLGFIALYALPEKPRHVVIMMPRANIIFRLSFDVQLMRAFLERQASRQHRSQRRLASATGRDADDDDCRLHFRRDMPPAIALRRPSREMLSWPHIEYIPDDADMRLSAKALPSTFTIGRAAWPRPQFQPPQLTLGRRQRLAALAMAKCRKMRSQDFYVDFAMRAP